MMDLELRNLLERLEALTARLEGLTGVSDGHGGSSGGVAPREAVYREALNEAVAVLEATRSSFRSRQLRDLRERIESVLRS